MQTGWLSDPDFTIADNGSSRQNRSCSGERSIADLSRGYNHRSASNERALANLRGVLGLSIVIRRDRPRSHVGSGADLRITKVG